MENIGLLKDLGTIMGAKEKLRQKIAALDRREQELLRLLKATKHDKVAEIRSSIIGVLKELRNQHHIWVAPHHIIRLVAEKLPRVLNEEISHQLRALGNLLGSGVAHNGQRGRGSAYFYIGSDR